MLLERWLAWYLGVSAPDQQGARLDWQLEGTNPLAPWPIWWGVGVVGLLIAAMFWRWWRQRSHGAGRRQSSAALFCRLLALLLFLIMLIQLSLRVNVSGRPTLIVMMDVSASMDLDDKLDPQEAQQLQQLLTESPPLSTTDEAKPRMSRLQVAQSVLLQDDTAWLSQLERDYRIALHPFANGLTSPTMNVNAATAPPVSATDLTGQIRGLTAVGNSTNLKLALQQAIEQERGNSTAAVLVLTDGNPTSRSDDTLAAGLPDALRREIPLFVVGVGASTLARDVRVDRVQHERTMFLGDMLLVEARIAGEGVAGETVRVQLMEAATGVEVATTEVSFPDQGRGTLQQVAKLDYLPHATGILDLEVRCQRLPGEGRIDNNLALTRARVRTGKLQVLLADRQPRWEYRHLKTTLERDPSVQLRTWLQESDLDALREDRTAVARLPETVEEWLKYDVVIWGDLNPAETAVNQQHVETFVTEHGGGLLLLPNMQSTFVVAFPDLSPASVTDDESGMLPAASAPLRLTLDGRSTSFLQQGDQRTTFVDRLPALRNIPRELTLRAGAVALLETAASDTHFARPVLIEHRVGSGFVMLQIFAETWRWRPLDQGAVYRSYWSQLVRHLAKRKLDRSQPNFELLVDRPQYEPGSTVLIRLLSQSPLVAPQLELSHDGAAPRLIPFAAMSQPGEYQLPLSELPPGNYTARLPASLTLESPSVSWKVTNIDLERSFQPLNVTDLKAAAQKSGGVFYRPIETKRLAADLPRGSQLQLRRRLDIALWSRWETLLLFVASMALEWWLRR